MLPAPDPSAKLVLRLTVLLAGKIDTRMKTHQAVAKMEDFELSKLIEGQEKELVLPLSHIRETRDSKTDVPTGEQDTTTTAAAANTLPSGSAGNITLTLLYSPAAYADAEHNNFVFGRHYSLQPCTLQEGYAEPIPNVLLNLKAELVDSGGLAHEGVFRKAPLGSELTALKRALNLSGGILPSSEEFARDADTLATLIKQWFRDAPTGLLDAISLDEMAKVMEANHTLLLSSSSEKEAESKQEPSISLGLLSRTDRALLYWLLDLSVLTCQHETANKMTPKAMAVVLGPNLKRLDDPMMITTVNSFFEILLRERLTNGARTRYVPRTISSSST
eukprot:gb/GEZN01010141.1/.p1 GENE.gb/GEZN01010141.1/~~gb/GEZN01010141.1/.p1  ORF type:complete len:385 (+),score=63.23 gb/GEZN01010141.1/:158-1156(+)